jgi:hypothetical protein
MGKTWMTAMAMAGVLVAGSAQAMAPRRDPFPTRGPTRRRRRAGRCR